MQLDEADRITHVPVGDLPRWHIVVQAWSVEDGQTLVIEVTSADSTRPFSDGGDSGALVVDDDGIAVGIIFSGDEEATYLNPIAAVLGLLQISF